MIKHIVCFKLKDNSDENKKETKEILMSMKDKVPMVRDIQVGVDFLKSPRSYDIILQVELMLIRKIHIMQVLLRSICMK